MEGWDVTDNSDSEQTKDHLTPNTYCDAAAVCSKV